MGPQPIVLSHFTTVTSGATRKNRTPDKLITNQPLYLLSYSGKLVAGLGFAPRSGAYETPELLLLYPALYGGHIGIEPRKIPTSWYLCSKLCPGRVGKIRTFECESQSLVCWTTSPPPFITYSGMSSRSSSPGMPSFIPGEKAPCPALQSCTISAN